MYLELTGVQSVHPDFKLPTRRNGEPLQPLGFSVQGQFIVARYLGWEPVSGPAVDEYLLDIVFNSDGEEIFRASSRMLEEPPEPTPLLARLRYALCLIFNVLPVRARSGSHAETT
ncbi:MAG: hypothetical protein WCF26_25150 [Candidatus Sulfotelmatobacter sp.]